MALLQMAEKIKMVHPDYVIFFKSGIFYYTYKSDAYIVSALFDYLMKYTDSIPVCGVSEKAINKVIARLEQEKINYMIIEPRREYEVEEKLDNGNLNKYNEVFKKAHKTVKQRKSIDKIVEELKLHVGKDDFKSIIRKIEDVLDEC